MSQYHIKKLLTLNLIREEGEGYVVNRVVLENFIRIRRISIPIQTAYVAFFGATFFILLTVLRPTTSINSIYFFALVINAVALGIFIYEMAKTLKHL
ncbi:MAG: hypothetical protein M1587_05725 [Thaumarchaeota archaeon]|nr:hypothetical protein [Nitrososphaerota archaeon]